MSSRASFRPEALDLAVVALSARALAASARRAGLSALAIDLFADADTREHAALAVRAPASRRGPGFAGRRLLETLATHAPKGLPVVLGAGFEHAPGLMRAIARRNPILGASPETVALLKDSSRFAAMLRDLGVPHPALTDDAAARAQVFLSKRIGASGGAHIREGRFAGRSASGRYQQAFVPGRAVSALFIADGRTIAIVGFSGQWTDPTPRTPYRYGGAVGPVALPCPLTEEIAAALDRIVCATGLVGLASADLILPESGGFVLLEINPRPGATLDVFERSDAPSLISLHLDACAGRLPSPPPAAAGVRAAAIVYADRPTSLATIRRPVWTADWPSCDEIVPAGAPICTVVASGQTPCVARARLEERRASLLSRLRAMPAAALNEKTHEEAHP